MSAHVLLNLSNKLGKKIKSETCRAFYLFFRNGFDKFNNTGVRMLDSIYPMTLKLFKPRIFGVKTSKLCHFYATLNERYYVTLLNL